MRLLLSTIFIFLSFLSHSQENEALRELYFNSFNARDEKNFKLANKNLREALKVDTANLKIYLFMAENYYLDDKWKCAIESIELFLEKIDKHNNKNFLDISWAHFLKGEVEKALEYSIEFFTLNPNYYKENYYDFILSVFRKGIYHFIKEEYSLFQFILFNIFSSSLEQNILYASFIEQLEIIEKVFLYLFKEIELNNLNSYLKILYKYNREEKYLTFSSFNS